jgi:hypothetical protein
MMKIAAGVERASKSLEDVIGSTEASNAADATEPERAIERAGPSET